METCRFAKVSFFTRKGTISSLENFYCKQLHLPLVNKSKRYLSVQAGDTILEFKIVELKAQPRYHFAFKINEHQIHETLLFLEENLEVIEDRKGNKINYLRQWNANSIYMRDPVGNLVEFMAHRSITPSNSSFDTDCLVQNICKVDLVSPNPGKLRKEIVSKLGLYDFRTSFWNFIGEKALGDTNGMLILKRKNTNWRWTNEVARDYKSEITIKATKKSIVRFTNNLTKIIQE